MRSRTIGRWLPRALVGLGAVVIVAGFLLGPLLPTPDPTPATLARDARQERRWRTVMTCGLALAAGGVVAGVAIRLRRRGATET